MRVNSNDLTTGGIVTTPYLMPYTIDWEALLQEAAKRTAKTYSPLKWNVYYENFNARKIEVYNVFKHPGFYADCSEAARKYQDKDAFTAAVLRSLRYYYWSKCEWEIVLTAWPPRQDFNDEKIDVAGQIELNWDRFIDYLWANKGALYAS